MSALLRRANKAPFVANGAADNSMNGVAEAASHLGKTLRITGILDTRGELHIHGNVTGRINAERLFLCPEANVEGDIVAKDVQIGGRFNGRVFAVNVTLTATANVTGRIFHHSVQVAKGAFVDGRMPWRPENYFESLEQLPENQP